jgi:hypothetical protein
MGRPRIVEGGIDHAFAAVTIAASRAAAAAASPSALGEDDVDDAVVVGDPVVSSNAGEGEDQRQ